jgi:hypothetical protein
LETYEDVVNDDDTVTNEVRVIGTANREGATSKKDNRFVLPIEPKNFTQIFRTDFSFARSALKQPAKWDRSGVYKEKAKDALLDHMTEMEMAFFFGIKGSQDVTENGETTPEHTTGGLNWFLQQWEAGDDAVDAIYRAGADIANEPDSNDDKRIINNPTGVMTKKQFDDYIERAFRITNSRTFEKLILCGSGFLAAFNTMTENYSVTMKNFAAVDTYGMDVTAYVSPFGTLYMKQHPLFTRDVYLRNTAIILDIQNLKYRPLNDSDTILLKKRQANDADRRKDEWLGEVGLECNFPESHMIMRNVQAIV